MAGRRLVLQAVFGLIVLAFCNANATTVWDENLNGDLSTDPLTPTEISLSNGANGISGSVQATGDTRDFFTFTLLSGQQLIGIDLVNYTDLNTSGPGNRGFHAIIDGPTSFIPSGGTAGNFLGGDHLEAGDGDLLAALAAAPLAGTGFAAPLGPGTYTYLVQQTGPQLTGYELNFQVVPLPASVWLFMTAAGLIFGRAKYQSN
ncbi:MAG: hypothetical protein AAF387_01310 [Pseudomonadota bacterium]